ncbi:MAG: MFS transporter [Actinomycetota bacterium]
MESKRRELGLLCAAALFHFTMMGAYVSALPLYVAGPLGGSEAAVGIAVGSFFLTAVLFRPTIGRYSDRIGRKPILLGASALMLATSAGFYAADSIPVVTVLRLFHGAAGGAFYTAAATLAADLAPRDRRAEYITLLSLSLYGGFAIGPALGEWLATGAGFSWVWGTTAGLAGTTIAIGRMLPETVDRSARAGIDRGGGRRLFFALHGAALLPGSVLMCAAAGYSSIMSFAPLYARDLGMKSSGGLYATFAITILSVRLLSRRLADRRGRVVVAAPGLIAGCVGLSLLAGGQAPVAAFIGVAVFGAGFALIFPALMALTIDRAPDSERGDAQGSFTAFFDIGAGIGSYAVGVLANAFGFGVAYALPAAMCAGGAAILRTRLATRVPAPSP